MMLDMPKLQLLGGGNGLNNTQEEVIGSFGGKVLYGIYYEEVVNDYADITSNNRHIRVFQRNLRTLLCDVNPVNVYGNLKVLDIDQSSGSVLKNTVVPFGTPYFDTNITKIIDTMFMKHYMTGSTPTILLIAQTEIAQLITSVRFRVYLMYTKD